MSNFNPDLSVPSSSNSRQISAAANGRHRRDKGSPSRNRAKLKKLHGGATAGGSRKQAEAGAVNITRPCSECGKTFWSWKALFGHMRCHPERRWRGINPPPNHRRNLPLSLEDHEGAASLLLLANGGISAAAEEEKGCSIDGCDHRDTKWEEEVTVGHGEYWALDLNFPPAHQYNTIASPVGFTLDLRLGL